MKPFGMRILAIKRTANSTDKIPEVDFLGEPPDLIHVMSESDYLVLSVVSTPDTAGIIGAKEIAAMKKTAFLVNVSRSEITNEKALIQALREGQLAGAAFDVFSEEPVAHDNPLLHLPNVILTPHVGGGGGSMESGRERISFFVENFSRVARGDPPLNVVDSRLKYVVSRSLKKS